MGAEVIWIVLMPLVMLTFVGVLAWWIQRRVERGEAAWRKAAGKRGLSLSLEGRGKPIGPWEGDVQREIGGTVEGVAVRLTGEYSPMSSNKLMTFGEAKLPVPVPTRLQVRHKGVLRGGMWTILDGPDIKTGDATFDAAFDVRGDSPAEVVSVLSPEVRQAMLAVARFASGVELHSDRVMWWTPSDPLDESQIVARLDATVAVANAVMRAGQGGPWYLPSLEGEADAEAVAVEAQSARGRGRR